MKRTIILTITLVYLGISMASAQLFPKVSKATSPDASMLALQFAKDENGELLDIINTNVSSWIPIVTDSNGKLVEFRIHRPGTEVHNVYYAENLVAGEYTMIGFYHVYTDYDKLDEYKLTKGESYIAEMAPYKNLPYHIRQQVKLNTPLKIDLVANKMMSLGSYAVDFVYIGGISGTTNDRWKIDEEKSKITKDEPDSQYVLRYMKPWATRKWKTWNAKNPAEPLEE